MSDTTFKKSKNKLEIDCECGLTHVLTKGDDDNFELETFYRKGRKEQLQKEEAERLKKEQEAEAAKKIIKKDDDWL